MPELDNEQRPFSRVWIFAGLAALALHFGGAALAFARLEADDLDEAVGAPAIEIGLEMTSPHFEPTDLPAVAGPRAFLGRPRECQQKNADQGTKVAQGAPFETADPQRRAPPNHNSKAKEDRAQNAAGPTQ